MQDMTSDGHLLQLGTRVRFTREENTDGTIISFWTNDKKVIIGYIVKLDNDPTNLQRVKLKDSFKVLRI